MTDYRANRTCQLLTGTTGFIGSYLLAAQLKHGRRCAVLVRQPIEKSMTRLTSQLRYFGFDSDKLIHTGQLIPVAGDLRTCQNYSLPQDCRFVRIIHAAACTGMERTAAGEPYLTNVDGTQNLLKWATAQGIHEFHLLSTAYVCGNPHGRVLEQLSRTAQQFRNAYEESKYLAEAASQQWAEETQSSLTVYRPSIVVGEHQSGRATKFTGIYLTMRACAALRDITTDDPSLRHAIPLRIRGSESDRQNIVPVDYVSVMIDAVLEDPSSNGRVYHLCHPNPPSNKLIQRALDHYFDIGGGRFVSREEFDLGELNDYERTFDTLMRPLRPYIFDSSEFDRHNTNEVEQAIGITCPEWDMNHVENLIRYAEAMKWGRFRPEKQAKQDGRDCARYFEEYLPKTISLSQVARVAGLTTTVRFIIDGVIKGQWVCRFENGVLLRVSRGKNGICEDFAYHTDEESFWKIVSGRIDPQQVFLNGRADITGNTEQALKMGVVLRAFNRENLYARKDFAIDEGRRYRA